jgi:hypothetical protein
MELKDPKITILIEEEYTTIQLHDTISNSMIFEIKLTPQQLSSALSKLARTPCKATLYNLNRVGKKMEHKSLSFPIPETDYNNRKEVAINEVKKYLPEGWNADNYFSSQDSFFFKDNKPFARTTIRRWVDINQLG